MRYYLSPLTNEPYRDNTRIEKFLMYKIIYPVVNRIGLNRKFNLLRHRLGLYAELPNHLCQWCGLNHDITPISEYRDKSMEAFTNKVINNLK